MLEQCHEPGVTCAAWESAELRAELPADESDFFARRGPLPVHPESRRAYPRFYLRGKAVLDHAGAALGVYTVDVSRQGIRFYSPVQLLPKDRPLLILASGKELRLEIVRCRRRDERCYDCGATFAAAD
jgi:hypothetical protein